jgi:hypothetical protein
MNTARFWTGIVMLTGLAIAIILALTPNQGEVYGPVEGTVMYRGRPVTGGTIFFLAENRQVSDAVHAEIGSNGHYRCDTSWHRDRTTAKRFRIFVVLNKRDDPPPVEKAEAVASDDDDNPRFRLSTDEGARPTARLVRASTEWPDTAVSESLLRRWMRHRFSNPYTTDLAVRLSAEPARVDVALKD